MSPPVDNATPATQQSLLNGVESSRLDGRLPKHIPGLDGLRGMAILLVFLYHAAEWLKPQTGDESPIWDLLRSGWVGVDLFFVLSGFLITGILWEARGAPHGFRNFYMRRVLRIFPLYYGVLTVLFVVLPHLGWYNTPELEVVLSRQAYLWTYTQNLFTAWKGQMLFRADWLNVGHFWSLAIEEQFYLFWPLLVLKLRRPTLIKVCLFIIVFSPSLRLWSTLSGAQWVTPYTFTLCRLDTLALGGLLAILARGPIGLGTLFRLARWVALASGSLLLLVFFLRDGLHCFDRWIHSLGFSVLAVFFASLLILVVAVGPRGILGRIFTSRLLRTYGKYSYALYVYHKVLEAFVLKWDLPERLRILFGNEIVADVTALLIWAAFFLGVASLSWHLYEKHFLKLKRFFDYGTSY